MPQFLLFLFLIAGVFSLLYVLANANIATLARNLRLGAVGILAIVGIALTVAGRWSYALPLLFVAWTIYRSGSGGGWSGRGKRAGQKSRVTSSFLGMELDHDTGVMDGDVTNGQFAGRRLNDLNDQELHMLAEEIASDDQSADLLEAYLERRQPGWREGNTGQEQAKTSGRRVNEAMTIEEAREVLGVAPNATDREIRAAHRAMMKDMHPDQGGSTYFAAKLNQARDMLLKKPTRQK